MMRFRRKAIGRIVILAIVIGIPMFVVYRGAIAFFWLNAGSVFDRHVSQLDIAYGTGARQRLDVYAPAGARNRPTALFWYGGAWMIGSKADFRFVGSALADAGYVAILPDYRLYPEVRLPSLMEDGALAVRWARDHAAEFGGNPGCILLIGHSAGAHLAATLAYDGRHLDRVGLDRASIRGFIGLSGPYAVDPALRRIYSNVFPMPPNREQDWLPVLPGGPQPPAALLIQGTDDWMVSPQRATEFAARLRQASVPVAVRIYEGGSHQDTVAPIARLWRFRSPVLDDVRGFIERAGC